ncbi:hypothetical protein, partial [Streptococcus suis]|uniref:hypothetical protein n=1 Tax=Streptococcus suis TaxID=1307 RepID=UPI001EE007B3
TKILFKYIRDSLCSFFVLLFRVVSQPLFFVIVAHIMGIKKKELVQQYQIFLTLGVTLSWAI